MERRDLITKGAMHAVGTFLYVAAIVTFLSNAKYIFGEKDSALIPVFMLLLFILSATITSLLVLGKPIQLYLVGSKTDATKLLIATLAWLFVFLLFVGSAMIMTRG